MVLGDRYEMSGGVVADWVSRHMRSKSGIELKVWVRNVFNQDQIVSVVECCVRRKPLKREYSQHKNVNLGCLKISG